jgi:tuftelin-interacting protein 11
MSSMHAFARDSSSESSDEEDDFLHPSTDPNADEFADYNPRKRRRTGRNAKESAALGVFGSESEEDDGPGRKWKRKSNLRGKGMAFVSTGQKTFDDDDDDEEDEEEGEEDMEMEDAGEDEEAEAPKGLGFGNAPRGLGFQSPAPGKKINNVPKASTPLGRGFVPSSAAIPILKNNDDDEVSTPRIARPSAFSTPASNGRSAKKAQAGPSVNAGSFAARMMAKMGYREGEGLGKDGTGRSGVIEVTLRPQGVGLGAVKEKSKQEIEEEKRQAKIRGEKYEDSDEERKKRRKKPRASGIESGSGSGMSTPRRAQKPKFRTLEEVQRAAPGLQIPDAFAPILDMTAPGQRLLTSTSGLLTPTAGTESVEQIESKKLARRAQNDLSAYVEEWKNLEERKAYIEMTIIQHQQELDEEQREFDRMKSFAISIHSISQSVSDLQWDPVLQALLVADPLSESGNSTVNEELSNIAVAAVHPFLRQATEGWQPLEDPKLTGMAPQLSKIRHILGATSGESKSVTGQDYLVNDGSHRIHTKSTTAYESMIYKVIFPKIVSAINQSWDVYDPTPLLSFFEAWEGLLPSFVHSQILNQAVVGKLNEAVSSWNPKKRRTHELPHLWLFPWLQYLPAHHADPESSTGLVSDVKRKFRQLIDTWDFHKGVVPGLRQWREVLSTSSKNNPWMSLVMNHVIPSMARFLQNEKNFVVDPNDQGPYMSALQGIFAWTDILSPKVVGEVIGRTVFPGWHSVLHQWLTVVGPNEEIGQWFEWWRHDVFPDEIKNLPSIQKEFDKGHEMINQALDLGSLAATQLPAPSTRQRVSPPPAKTTPDKSAPAPVEESTFKHKVEDWCIENDLQLLPEKKVLHSAGPLYRITAAGNGKNGTLAYFKGDSLWALSRKGAETAEVRIDWESPDARDALFGMAWQNVK